MPDFDCVALLRCLARNEVEFIVVGGVGEVLQGVPSITRGLDVVYRRDSANIQRTISAINSLDARSRVGRTWLQTRLNCSRVPIYWPRNSAPSKFATPSEGR
jgi:hypothetical protein